MWIPWVGEHYDATRLLLLGESAYSWTVDGKVVHPPVEHSCNVVEWAIGDFPRCVRHGRFVACLSRALANEKNPGPELLRSAWNRVAFTNYVGETVGLGPRLRPSDAMWKAARDSFPALLERLRPRRIILLGREMWGEMPQKQIRITEDIQGYRLADGSVAYCWATRHPARGLGWEKLAAIIDFVCGNQLAGR